MHRFAKLKTMGKNAGAEAANGVDAPTPPSTPKTKTPVSRKRKAAATPATSGSNNDDEEDTPISPSEAKKRRTSTAKPRTARKATAGTTSKKGGKGGKNIKQEGEFPASAAASGDEQGGLKNENVSDEEGGEDDKNGLVDMEFNEGEENEEGEEWGVVSRGLIRPCLLLSLPPFFILSLRFMLILRWKK